MLVTTLVVAVVAVAAETRTEPTYEAATTVRLVTRAALSDEPVRNDDILYRDRLENTYVELIGDSALRNDVRDSLGLATRPRLRAEPRPNTELLDIVAEARTPALAVQIADAAAAALIDRVRALSDRDASLTDQIFASRIVELEADIAADRRRLQELPTDAGGDARANLAETIRGKRETIASQRADFERNRLAATTRARTLGVVNSAEAPDAPASSGPVVYGVLGVLVGLIGGLGLAFLVENLRPRLHSSGDVENASALPVLAEIPNVRDSAWLFNGASGISEAFVSLRTNILASYPDGGVPVVLFTSGQSGEGKSTIVSNLAQSIAASNRTVVIVDADLRSPSIHEIFGVGDRTGLTNVLARHLLPIDAVSSTLTPGVYVMTSGIAGGNPAALLGSKAMGETLAALSERFDAVLIDSPSLIVSDALALAQSAKAVVLVTRPGRVAPDALRTMRDQTSRVGARLLGVVLNDARMPSIRRAPDSPLEEVQHA